MAAYILMALTFGLCGLLCSVILSRNYSNVICLIAYAIAYFYILNMKDRPTQEYEYGTCNNLNARRHTKKGNVQMCLHKAGEHGNREDYWHDFDSSWWDKFEPY